MNINENVNFNGQMTVKDSSTGAESIIGYLNATLNAGDKTFSIGLNSVNKTLLEANAENAKAQYTEFETAVKKRAIELGYVIF